VLSEHIDAAVVALKSLQRITLALISCVWRPLSNLPRESTASLRIVHFDPLQNSASADIHKDFHAQHAHGSSGKTINPSLPSAVRLPRLPR
jgi:hypothetical protein